MRGPRGLPVLQRQPRWLPHRLLLPRRGPRGRQVQLLRRGKGQRVKNNAASAWNRDHDTLRIYYNENYSGPYDSIPAGDWENLVNTWNDNASLEWV